MLRVQTKGNFIFHPTLSSGQTPLLAMVAGGRDVLACLHSPSTTAKGSPVQPSCVGTATPGTSLCTAEHNGLPSNSLPHTPACRGEPDIALHLLSLNAFGHRGTISHGTVTSCVGGMFRKATADYVFGFCFKSSIKQPLHQSEFK